MCDLSCTHNKLHHHHFCLRLLTMCELPNVNYLKTYKCGLHSSGDKRLQFVCSSDYCDITVSYEHSIYHVVMYLFGQKNINLVIKADSMP